MKTSRRRFLATGLLTSATLGATATHVAAAEKPVAEKPELSGRPPPLDSELVFRTVRVAHFDLAELRTLLEREPKLANATWDWGGGDWETPLEAASHVGKRDIARHLLEHGARQSLFASAMLGDRATVAGAVTAAPGIVNTHGPHRYSLLYHAASSGDVAMAELIKPHLASPGRDSNQALHAAARDGHRDMTAWLLTNGVTNPNSKDFAEKTPLMVAKEKGFASVAAVLREHGVEE